MPSISKSRVIYFSGKLMRLFSKFMNMALPRVYFDITFASENVGRIIMEVFIVVFIIYLIIMPLL